MRNAAAVAQAVQARQAAILSAAAGEAAAAEAALYASALEAAAAEAAARRYQRDTTKLTMREKLAAKARKEEMLARSVVCARSACGEGGPGAALA